MGIIRKRKTMETSGWILNQANKTNDKKYNEHRAKMKIYQINDIISDLAKPIEYYVGVFEIQQTQILNGHTGTVFILSFGLLKEQE
jgi:hypothetical protein